MPFTWIDEEVSYWKFIPEELSNSNVQALWCIPFAQAIQSDSENPAVSGANELIYSIVPTSGVSSVTTSVVSEASVDSVVFAASKDSTGAISCICWTLFIPSAPAPFFVPQPANESANNKRIKLPNVIFLFLLIRIPPYKSIPTFHSHIVYK